MAEPTQFVYKFKELTELLLKERGITQGHWGVLIRFGFQATNITAGTDVLPAAIIPVVEIGIQKFDEANALTVDAAELAKAKKK